MQQNLNEAGKKYTVFEVTNLRKGSDYGKKLYTASAGYLTKENLVAKLRAMKNSKTSQGGTQELAADIKAAGKDYKDDFEVEVKGSGLSLEQAEKLKGEYIAKNKGATYNQEMAV